MPSGRPVRSTAVALLVTLALAGLSLMSLRAAVVALPNLQLDAPVVPPTNATGGALAPRGRVLLVVIDGLRADVASQLPFLDVLAQRGARANLTAESPTYSSAQYVAMLTGVPPWDSGVRTNTRLGRTQLDNVPRRLRADGRRAVQIGDQVDWWERMFGDDFAATGVVAPDALVDAAARDMPRADLEIVHICGVDEEGHRVGADSPEYGAAARAADDKTRALAEAWGWPAATVVALSDHGHLRAGGHGGDEPDVRGAWLVASGPAIRSGARVSEARMIDVAPTLAALLGTAAPGTAQGRTLIEALALPAQASAALDAADKDRIVKSHAAADTRRRALAFGQTAWGAARLVGLTLALALAWFGLRFAWGPARLGFLAGAGALLLTVVAFLLRYGHVSFSADRSTQRLGTTVGLLAIGAAALPFAPALIAALRGRLKAADASALAVGATIGAAPIAALTFVTVGAFQARLGCEPAWFAALPLCAYAAFASHALAASLITATASALSLFARNR